MATINCIWKNSIWNWCISFELQKERKSGNARSLPHSCYHHHREILLENVLMIQFGVPEQKWSEHMTSAVFLLVTLLIVLPPGRRSCLRCLWLFYCDSFTQGCREPAAPSTNGRVQFLFAWLWTLVMKKNEAKNKIAFFLRLHRKKKWYCFCVVLSSPSDTCLSLQGRALRALKLPCLRGPIRKTHGKPRFSSAQMAVWAAIPCSSFQPQLLHIYNIYNIYNL